LIVTLNSSSTSISTLPCLFDSIWVTEKSGKDVILSMQGTRIANKVCFEELDLASDCPQKVLRLKSILLAGLK